MILFVIGLVAALIALGVFVFAESKKTAIVPAALAAVLLVLSCIAFVPTGHTGILVTFGRVEDKTLPAGIAFVAPWQSVVKMDNRLQERTEDLLCFSSDIQEVSVSLGVGYRINQQNAMTLYKEVGKKYEDTIVSPLLQEVVKTVVAKYTASELVSSRSEANQRMTNQLGAALAAYNIDLDYISIKNIDFTDTFTDAVEAKVKAEQEKEQAETEAEKKKIEAEAAAQAAIIEAQAEAEKSKAAADAELYVAEKRAEANRELSGSLSDQLLEYRKIEEVLSRWNGELPQYMGGESSVPILGSLD